MHTYMFVTVVGFQLVMSVGMLVRPRELQSILVPEQEHADGHPTTVVVVVVVVVGISVVVTQDAIGNRTSRTFCPFTSSGTWHNG